jgi:uncharacterized protein DUF4242
MPKFIDTHRMKPIPREMVKKLQHAAKDEFGVTHHDILFNEKEDRLYCVLDAPNREAVEKHHAKAGIQCEWIREVESSRT